MSTHTDELREFHQFLGKKLNSNGANLSPEEVLDEWRRLHPEPQASIEDVAAIQEALDDLANGDRGVTFEEFDREFRKRHDLPAKP